MTEPTSRETDATLGALADLVLTSPHNLMSRSARAELLTRHIPECLALARLLPAGSGRLLDVGSGGGFPGLVIAIERPDLEVHLLDATAKKTDFLRDAAQRLGCSSVTVHTGRAEDLVRTPLEGTFDLVSARAVAPLARLLPLTIPFLRPMGLLYAIKGERWLEELEAATPVLSRVGARVVATPEDMTVPDDVDDVTMPRVVMIARDR